MAVYRPLVAPDLDADTADLAARLWQKGLTKDGLSKKTTDEVYANIIKPDNLSIYMAEINQEVYNVMGKQARNKDYRYKNIQKAVAYAAIPLVKIMDTLAFKDTPSETDLQDIVDGATV